VGVYGSIQNLEKQNEVSVFIKRFQDVIINPEKASGARFFYWDLSIELIKQRPLFGNKIYSNQEMTAWGYGLVERSAYSGRSHNNYIAVTYAYGIVGFLVYLTLIYFVYKKLRWLKKNQNNSSHQFLNFVFISNVVGGLFVGDYFNFVCSPFILALIVYAGQNIHKNDMEFTPPRKR
jgi:O-antigen ligase